MLQKITDVHTKSIFHCSGVLPFPALKKQFNNRPYSYDCAYDGRAVNAELFRAADLSLSVEGLPVNQPLASLPVASASCFSAIDVAFNTKLVGLHSALPLGDVVSGRRAEPRRSRCSSGVRSKCRVLVRLGARNCIPSVGVLHGKGLGSSVSTLVMIYKLDKTSA